MLSSVVPQGVIHAQNITQRRLMHIEQAVEDISDLFLRVYIVLGAVPSEGATFVTEEVSPASWDEYYQRFLSIAARSRRNLQDAVAVMDGASRFLGETVLTDIGRSSHADARTALKLAEELMRTKVACGRSALDDLTKLAQKIHALRDRLDLKPAVRHRTSVTNWLIPAYREVVRYIGDTRMCPHRPAKMSLCRYMSALLGLVGQVYEAAFPLLWRIIGRRSSRPQAASSTLSPNHSETRWHGYTSQGQIHPVAFLASEPDVSYTYPDTMKHDLERVAVDIERFAVTWSEISDEQERWAGYLARRAEHVDSDSNVADETDLTFCNEIAGTWDAITSIRHATLQRLNASGISALTEF